MAPDARLGLVAVVPRLGLVAVVLARGKGGMTLKDCRDHYLYYSGKTSDIVRQLGFAGIALVWVFKTDKTGSQAIPPELLCPTILIVLGLGLDFVHYVVGSLVWAAYNRHKELSGTLDTAQFLAPRSINWPTNAFFWAKIIVMLAAYVLIFKALAGRAW